MGNTKLVARINGSGNLGNGKMGICCSSGYHMDDAAIGLCDIRVSPKTKDYHSRVRQSQTITTATQASIWPN